MTEDQQAPSSSPSPSPPPPPGARRGKALLYVALEETGLLSLGAAPRDVRLLCLQRFVRMLGYGVSTLILVAYLDALGVGKPEIGLFMTLTLAGDVVLSFVLTLFADALGRRAVLALGAALMAASGVVFALSGTWWVLLVAAVVGVISPSGNEIGPFRAIEESIVAQLTEPRNRGDVYAWYSLFGLTGAACGFMICGWVLEYLTTSLGWGLIRSYRAVYVAYAAVGLLKLTLTLLLSHAVESEKKQRDAQRPNTHDETAPLLNGAPGLPPPDVPQERLRGLRSLLPDISRESIPVVATLCLLFGLDSFGTGLATLSWISYYFQYEFHVDEGKLGSFFFTTQVLAGISMIVASSLAKRFGNVNTMVFTHLPSQIFRSLIGVPTDMRLALLFCVVNASTQSMDTGPRAAFLAALIPARERTAVMGALNVVKTTASSLGPLLTGVLVDRRLFWAAFAASGALKILYDVGLLAFFKGRGRRRRRIGGREGVERRRRRGGDNVEGFEGREEEEEEEADERQEAAEENAQIEGRETETGRRSSGVPGGREEDGDITAQSGVSHGQAGG
ncbi:MFS general substrate transporter [Xylariomycetidae sp. FL2044]|nr:MFS general substrate transporter [Xylariomycetidae sp. FL2044]